MLPPSWAIADPSAPPCWAAIVMLAASSNPRLRLVIPYRHSAAPSTVGIPTAATSSRRPCRAALSEAPPAGTPVISAPEGRGSAGGESARVTILSSSCELKSGSGKRRRGATRHVGSSAGGAGFVVAALPGVPHGGGCHGVYPDHHRSGAQREREDAVRLNQEHRR